MASEVSTANAALRKLGENRILLLSDDNKAARTINGMFDDVRDQELRRARWKFALKRDSLPALVAAPAWGYAYQYTLPADFLALVQINDYYLRSGTKQKGPYALEAGLILTDYPAPLKIRYIARIETVAQWDPLFVEVVACKLAMEAAETLTQSETKRARAAEEYKFAFREAVRQDAIEAPADELPWGSWLDSREGENYGTTAADNTTSYPGGFSV